MKTAWRSCVPIFVMAMFWSFVIDSKAQSFSRIYQGFWTNTTFGSTGKALIDASYNGTNAVIKFDLDGQVFGQFDPPLITMPGIIQGAILNLNSKGVSGFGDIGGQINILSGQTSITVSNVPTPGIARVDLTGMVTNGVVNLNFAVFFPGDPNPAVGIIRAAAPQPLAITAVAKAAGKLNISWSGGKAPYQIEASDELNAVGWADFGPSIVQTNSQILITTEQKKFFRIKSQ